MEHMERQLANLTGLVQKALTHQTPATLQVPSTGRDSYRGEFLFSFSSTTLCFSHASEARSYAKVCKMRKSYTDLRLNERDERQIMNFAN